ncbi:MAG: hypothetical protein ACFE9L_11805, partial [Candidatus Hodarchaeota archaeon]
GRGIAKVRHNLIEDLGVHCHTNDENDKAESWIFIDGGYENADPWTLPKTEDYRWRVYWIISGNYDEEGSNYFKFEYELYYMEGSTKHVEDSFTKEYTSDFNYEDVTVVHANIGTVRLLSTKTYYLQCKITLSHRYTDAVSDMHDGGDEIKFDKVKFKYWVPFEP